MGLETVDPLEEDLEDLVQERTGGAGADVVFEVSGAAAGAEAMTGLARARGLIVVVAVFNEPPRIDLFRSFMRELRFCAVRAYEPEDFERSIALIAGGELPLERMISARRSLDELPDVFAQMESNPQIIKVLLDLKGA
jgi:threonine dehydrogenase-like Zn-dependent dehydrogenase